VPFRELPGDVDVHVAVARPVAPVLPLVQLVLADAPQQIDEGVSFGIRQWAAGRRFLAHMGILHFRGWRGGRLVHGPSGTCARESDRELGYQVVAAADSAINAGLKTMGVQAAGGLDEYAAAGLDRHRFTADWREK
jgi:hypothetical protein